MKINFENQTIQTNADTTTAYGTTRAEKTTGRMQVKGSGKMLTDISGIVMENAALKGQGKTADESAGDLLQTMVGLQKNYMSVMSDSMSGDDISRMMKEGFSPADVDLSDAVTIVDKIKAELVKDGNYVPGYTDDVDLEALKEVGGSEAGARAMAKALEENDVPVTKENLEAMEQAMVLFEDLTRPSEEAVAYLLKNDQAPTIEALHRAEYSGQRMSGQGYFAKAGESVEVARYSYEENSRDLDALEGSIEKILDRAGGKADPRTMEQAKDMVRRGIPLTAENLEKAEDIRNIDPEKVREDLYQQMAKAIASGKDPKQTSLTEENSVYLQGEMLYREVMGYGDTVTDSLAAEGKQISLRSIRRSEHAPAGSYPESAEVLHARRVFQEVRLQMTVEANIKLLQSGFSIETAELSDLVDALKLAERQQETALFGTEDAGKNAFFRETCIVRDEIPQMAAAVLGSVQKGEISFTLQEVETSSRAYIAKAEKAGEAYETMGTQVRADLGDNIKKAFGNVDAILEDLHLEETSINQKAVRILGYNAMEITEENITRIKDLYLTVQDVYEKLTPAATLRLIREGENPLELDMEELADYLSGNGQEPEESAERYSTFLYHLEENKEITPQERESYIGIYRFFKQLEKTDGAAIGAILETGERLSVRNLLKEMRSARKNTMDYTVDDGFNGVEGINKKTSNPIDAQISAAYSARLVAAIPALMESRDVIRAGIGEEDTPEELAAKLLEAPQAKENNERIRQIRKEILQTAAEDTAGEESILERLEVPVTANQILALRAMEDDGQAMMKTLYKGREKDAEEDFRRLTEAMDDPEKAEEAYISYTEKQGAFLSEAMLDAGDVLDLRQLQNAYRQLTIAGRQVREEEYHIPVEIAGELTSIHLTLRHDQGSAPTVELSAMTGETKMQLSFTKTLSGYAAKLENGNDALKAKILEEFADIKDVNVFFEQTHGSAEASTTATNAELYRVAKTALSAIAKMTGGNHEDLL